MCQNIGLNLKLEFEYRIIIELDRMYRMESNTEKRSAKIIFTIQFLLMNYHQ